MEKVARKVTFEEAERLDKEFWAEKPMIEKLKVLTSIRITAHGGQRLVKAFRKINRDH